MKKYNALGELLIDYRYFHSLSQRQFADKIEVDIRTVQRWESDITLIKSDIEEKLVLKTLLPFQLIRNLNAVVTIPTFYDFEIRKYALTEMSNELPNADWFKSQIDITTNRIRKIDIDLDFTYIKNLFDYESRAGHPINKNLVVEGLRRLPELNFVIIDDAGYYSGHCITLPIKDQTYEKLKNRTIEWHQIEELDLLLDYKNKEKPIFFNYNITADSNENIFYLVSEYLRFYRDLDREYLLCAFTERYDTFQLSEKFGMRIIWEDHDNIDEKYTHLAPRFVEGTFDDFLK